MKMTRELLERYELGTCTEEERKAVEQWLSSSANQAEKLLDDTTKKEIKTNVWNLLSSTVTRGESKPGKVAPLYRKLSPYVAAASILLLIAWGIGWLRLGDDLKLHRTDFGETQPISLEDGSKIYLNANSVLNTPEKFEEDVREVWLEGEAFFAVAKDAHRPFLVHTKSSQTKVLGTKFNLSEFSGSPPTLTLKEGKVAFSGTGENQSEVVYISPNEQVTIAEGVANKQTVDADNFLLWMDGEFYVDGETLESISKKIRHLYGVEVIISNPEIGMRRYRGVLANDDLTSLLEELSFVLDFKYDHKDKVITIY
ncbi:MAG: FecR domain-containing protein [Bacteroidota bacterium]